MRDNEHVVLIYGVEREVEARAGSCLGDHRDIRNAQYAVRGIVQILDVGLEADDRGDALGQWYAKLDEIGQFAEATAHRQRLVDPNHGESAPRSENFAGAQVFACLYVGFKVRDGEWRLLLRERHA